MCVRCPRGRTNLDREIVDRCTALLGVCLGQRVTGGAFEKGDTSAEDGDLLLLFFELMALFFYFFVGDALLYGVAGIYFCYAMRGERWEGRTKLVRA